MITRPVNGFFCSKSWHVHRIHFISPLDCSGGPDFTRAHALRVPGSVPHNLHLFVYQFIPKTSSRMGNPLIKRRAGKLPYPSTLSAAKAGSKQARPFQYLALTESKDADFAKEPMNGKCYRLLRAQRRLADQANTVTSSESVRPMKGYSRHGALASIFFRRAMKPTRARPKRRSM
jgi:hypothetical protein